ncbi:MAG: archaellin/type IV pilin N-terminal domain-containing protein [Nitrososphaerales archaeon]
MINRIRKGVSPVIATTIIITLTLVVGFAVWSFVNSEAAAASGAFGESTASNVNYLREKFVITNAAFNSNGTITIWFYNNGAVNTQIKEIYIGTSTTSMIKVPSGNFTRPLPTLIVGNSGYTTFYHNTYSGNTYYIKAVGQFGNIALYYQKA